MSNNGTAALQLLDEPPSVHPKATDKTKIEIEIGAAVADAVRVLAAGMIGYQQTSALAPAIREAGGEKIAALVHMAMSSAGEIDFDVVARREGRKALLPLLDYPESSGAAPGRGEAVIADLIDGTLMVVRRVVALELAWAS